VLQEVASKWTAELRQGDVLARVGGDEFIAVLNDCDDGRARAVAERLVAVIPAPVSACVGMVALPAAKDAPPAQILTLLANVDAALYEGKSSGPGSIVLFREASLAPAPSIPPARHPAA
jgi:diguanylate cyclase (GGDEF)-like protein